LSGARLFSRGFGKAARIKRSVSLYARLDIVVGQTPDRHSIDRDRRLFDRSKFPLRRLFSFAMDGFLAHSILPLRLATYFGFVMAGGLFLLGFAYLIGRLLAGSDWPSGFATLAVLLAMGASLNAIFLGIIGEYVGRIYNQVRQRPNTVIEYTINLDEPAALQPPQLSRSANA